jgi:hypothetical protein
MPKKAAAAKAKPKVKAKPKKKEECQPCMAVTQDGKMCSRDADCNKGCPWYCKQHRKLMSCLIYECEGFDRDQPFPCSRKGTLMHDYEELLAYKEMREDRARATARLKPLTKHSPTPPDKKKKKAAAGKKRVPKVKFATAQ